MGQEENDTSAPTGEEEQGFFKSNSDLTKVEGMEDDLGKYPALNFFADVQSNVFSIYVIGKLTTIPADASEEDEDVIKDVVGLYQYREVVVRSQNGLTTIFVERRRDPDYNEDQ